MSYSGLLTPGISKRVRDEAGDLDVCIQHDMNGYAFRSGKHAIRMPEQAILSAMEKDNYAAIDRMVSHAVRFLKHKVYGNVENRRRFRTKMRSIRAHLGQNLNFAPIGNTLRR